MAFEKEPYRPGLSKDAALVQQLQEYERNPKSLVFASLADRYRAQGLVKQAIEIIEEGLEVHPDFGPALVVKARCFFDQKRYADCLELLTSVLAKNPENVRAERLRADVFLRLGQKRAAIGSLTRVVALVPNDISSRKALAEIRSLDERPKVEQALEKKKESAVFADHNPGRIFDFQVQSLRGSDGLSAAVESPAQVYDEIPKSGLSLALESSPPAFEAITPEIVNDTVADEEEDEELNPLGGVTFATRTIAELYLRQGLAAKAQKILEAILERSPGDPWATETLEKISEKNDKHKDSQVDRTRLMLKARYLERMLAKVQSMRRVNAL